MYHLGIKRNKSVGLYIAGLCALLLCCGVGAQPTPTIDMLVADLASGVEMRQVSARQQLPLRGPEVAEKILPLLNDERDAVYFAALRVLEDVIHETNRHGDEAAQTRVADAVFSLLTPDATERQQRIGLELAPLAVCDGQDLSPVVALLDNSDMGERARNALIVMGTNDAVAALCDALPGMTEDEQLAVLRGLVLCTIDDDHADALYPFLTDGTEAVQAATLRVLAPTGKAALLPHARRIVAEDDGDGSFEGWDGWLRLSEAYALRGGHWELAIASYREILDTTPHPLIQSGAVVGLGRFGDVSVMPYIMAALNSDAGSQLEPAVLEAFRKLQGNAANQRLIDVLPDLPDTMIPGMMVLFGEKGDPLFLEVLEAYALHDEAHVRSAAHAALAASGLPQAASVCQRLLADDALDDSERETLVEHLYTLARVLRQQGDAANAGRAYLAIYRNTDDETMHRAALEGIRRFPVPEAYDVVLDMLAEDDVESLPVSTMVGVALNAMEAGREAEGLELMQEIMPRLTTEDSVRHAVHAMRAHGPNPAFARSLGYINQWWMTGPFPWNPNSGFEVDFIGEPEVSLADTYEVDGETLAWERRESTDAAALFDLMTHVSPSENVVAFAYAEIKVDEGGPAQVRLGSDDGIRVWVNGEEVFQIDADRGYDIDQNIAEITLRDGKNVILSQITQLLGGWAFTMRLTHPDGRPLEFEIVE